MATTIRIYNQANNRYYTATVDAFANILDNNGTDMNVDYYLKITTTMRISVTNAAFPQYVIRYLTDVPPGYSSPAATFTDLINDYIDYFITQANLGYSSSSTSSSSSVSSESSSSNSSSSSSYIENWSSSSNSSSSSSSSVSSSSSSIDSSSSSSVLG